MRRSRIVLALLVLTAALVALGGGQALSNPIPVPTLLMPQEDISVRIFIDGGRPWAIVEGSYPFGNIGYDSVTMYYPVPPDATAIQVWRDWERLDWSYVTCGCSGPTSYPTALGDYRMITWQVAPVPTRFTIRVRYRHPLPQLEGRYGFLYALGTGRFLEYYSKETVAHVRVWFELGLDGLEASVGREPVGYKLDRVNGATLLELTEKSAPFQPLEDDLLIKFNRRPTVIEALDADGDRHISDQEVLQALRYWLEDAPIPGTGGAQLNDLTLFYLVKLWATGGVYVLTPYQARDRAIQYLKAQGQWLPENAVWEAQSTAPAGLVGSEAIEYTHAPWTIEVSAPVIPFPDYSITVTDSIGGFTWHGRISATGEVLPPES